MMVLVMRVDGGENYGGNGEEVRIDGDDSCHDEYDGDANSYDEGDVNSNDADWEEC